VEGIVDDFAAMREAVSRRYSRSAAEGKELPDLILIDGGIGQVNAAKGVLDALGITCGIVGLAKREEELWLPGAKDAVRLSERSEALKVLQFVRDETHRFATSFNQLLRSKDLRFPALESVEGVGPRRAAAIMRAMVSLDKVAAASAEDLAALCRIPEPVAKAVRAAAKLALADRAAEAARLRAGTGRKRQGAGTKETPAQNNADVGARLAAEAAEAAERDPAEPQEPQMAAEAAEDGEAREAAEAQPPYPNEP
jgi:excinuclease ABC subunit C